MTPTPQQIESFKKGLELGLVPSGWPSFLGRDNTEPQQVYIEAMEGLAGRVLIEALFVMQWTDSWRLFSYGIPHGKLPGDKDDTLTPLVAAVERLRG